MPKLKLSELRAICTDPQVAYKGENDPAKMKAWLSSQNISLKDGTEEVPIDKWELEDDAAPPKRVYSIPTTVKAADPPDLDVKIQSLVNERLKIMGLLDVSGRPKLHDPSKEIKVKTVDERIYEDRITAKTARFKTFENAKLFQLWMAHKMALQMGDHQRAGDFWQKYGNMLEQVVGKAYATTSATQGSALVPEVFRPELIRNVLEYGVCNQLTEVIQTNQPSVVMPRRLTGLTGYWPLENAAATQSTATYDNVQLNANTFEVLATASMQMLNDSGINFVDATMQEMALTIATMKDQCLLTGDGSATYGGMTGFEFKYGVAAAANSQSVTGATTSDAHTVAQVMAALAAVPKYAQANWKITCTPFMRAIIFDRLSYSVSGTQPQMLQNGRLSSSFLGIPIVENNVMSSVAAASTTNRPGFTANSQIDFLIGDFTRASKCLDVLDVELAMSSERGFDTYTMWFRAVTRFRCIVHDVGTATTAGPVIAFWQN